MLHPVLRLLGAVACAGALAPTPVAAQSMVGTLKCTAEVAQAGQGAARDWKIACAFEPVKGQVQHYAGAINDPGTEPRATGKAFLVWNVLAAAPEVQSGMLVGTYKQSKAAANTLVGGRGEAILLQPLTAPNQQDGINLAPRVSVVQLELPKV